MAATKESSHAPVYIEVDCLKRSDIAVSKASLTQSKGSKSQNFKMAPKFVIRGNKQSPVHDYEEIDPELSPGKETQLSSENETHLSFEKEAWLSSGKMTHLSSGNETRLSSEKEDILKEASSKPAPGQVKYENVNVISKERKKWGGVACAKRFLFGLFVVLLILSVSVGLAIVSLELIKLKAQLSSFQQESIDTAMQLQECVEQLNATEFLSQFIYNGTSVFNLLISLYHDLNDSIADIKLLNQTHMSDYTLLKHILALSSNQLTNLDRNVFTNFSSIRQDINFFYQRLNKSISDLAELNETYLSHYTLLSQMLTSSDSRLTQLTERHFSTLQQNLTVLDNEIQQLNFTRVQDYASINRTLGILKMNFSVLNQSFSPISSTLAQLIESHSNNFSVLQQNLTALNSQFQQLNFTHVQDYAGINRTLGIYYSVLQSLNELGQPSTPADSCAFLLAFNPSSPSGYYWVRASNGSAVRMYCDMTLSCGGVTGGWTRVVHLNVSESFQCPGSLRFRSDDVMLCGIRVTALPPACSSANFDVNQLQYLSVCGRIEGYRGGSPDAFHTHQSIDSVYVDGISLTYGSPRQHIWTFAAASDSSSNNCPCSGSGNGTFSSQLMFVGGDYFCDSASSTSSSGFFELGNPLWDSAGCAPGDTCCTFNIPPWFYKQFSEPITEDIEMRVCSDQVRGSEDIGIASLELYVK